MVAAFRGFHPERTKVLCQSLRPRNNETMPELPEVECVRRSLEQGIAGGLVVEASLLRPDVCESFDAMEHLSPTQPEHLLLGGRVVRVVRHGKQIAVVLHDGRSLCVHLGMTGQLLVENTNALNAEQHSHIHARWRIQISRPTRHVEVIFRDPRRFGGLWTFASFAQLNHSRWGELGPDALTITGDQLHGALRERRCALKAALLDQQAIAGIGNIYADEVLFRAGIDPRTPAGRLKPETLHRVAACIREILAEAINAGGTTLRDYRDATGSPGAFQQRHAVYGRAGEACVRCGTTLQGILLAQRSTVFCPSCQRRGVGTRER